MKNPKLAGILNVLLPGAGLAYLGKLKDALIYLLWVPIFVLFSKSILWLFGHSFLDQLKDFSTVVFVLNIAIAVVYWVSIAYIIWDLFSTPYNLAKGAIVRKNPAIAVLLNFIGAGLGFIYLKKWWLAFGYLFWIQFVVGLYGFISVEGRHISDTISTILKIIVILFFSLYAYWDAGVNAYKETNQINQKLQAENLV
jgi:hypothetical protein